MRLWHLTLGVSVAHLALLWGTAQWGAREHRLLVWDEPQLTHQVSVDKRASPLLSQARSDEKELPLSTIGQTLQVRTFVDVPQRVSSLATAVPQASPPIIQTALPQRTAPKKTSATPAPTPTPDEPTQVETATSAASESGSVTLAAAPAAMGVEQQVSTDAPSPTVLASVSASVPDIQASPPPKETPAPVDAVDVAAAVAHWPPATRLHYRLHGHYKGDLHGKAAVLWQRQGTRYQAQVDVSVSLFFHLRMTSQGRVTPQALWPEVYQEERRGKVRGIKMGDAVVQLDNGDTMPRPKRLQDTASQFVQLAQDFAHQRRPLRVGAVIPLPLARPGGVDEWVYDVVALDTLNTPLGQVPAFHLQPRPLLKARSSVGVEMWFAPSLQYLPARIRLNLGPEVWLDLLLESIDQAQTPTAAS